MEPDTVTLAEVFSPMPPPARRGRLRKSKQPKAPRKPRESRPLMIVARLKPEFGHNAMEEFPSCAAHTTVADAIRDLREHGVDGCEYLIVRPLLRKTLKKVTFYKSTLE